MKAALLSICQITKLIFIANSSCFLLHWNTQIPLQYSSCHCKQVKLIFFLPALRSNWFNYTSQLLWGSAVSKPSNVCSSKQCSHYVATKHYIVAVASFSGMIAQNDCTPLKILKIKILSLLFLTFKFLNFTLQE